MQCRGMEAGRMKNAERLLAALDAKLNHPVELTLYGRAALLLGFADPPAEMAQSKDIDGVFWLGQAEELACSSNFWEAIEEINRQFAVEGLYVSHFFEENQVILRPDWRVNRKRLPGDWLRLGLWRLSDLDLFLSKLMRDDPLDRSDAQFIIERGNLSKAEIKAAISAARVPDVPEIAEQFQLCARRFL
jgi:hypothetical protein